MTPRNPHLVLDALTIHYGESKAVDTLTLEIGKGELVSLLGPSGCGKTTTLRAIAGFVKATSGQIVLGGKEISRVPVHRRNIGVVFQSYALFPHLTTLDNVAFGLRMRHVGAAERRERAAAALDMVGLKGFADRYPANLSGGQQQRVALARALVIEPEVLLLDEPLSNLDANLRADMRLEIRSLQQRLAITTIFVTHDQQEALAMSDRIAVMSKGIMEEVGTPLALCDKPTAAFTASFLGARTVIEGRTEAGIFRANGLECRDAPDGATRLVLRAARLTFGDAPGPLSLAGTITANAFLGDTYEADVLTAAGTVRVVVPSQTPPPPIGAACALQAQPGGASFIH